MFGLGWNWTSTKKSFLPRLKIEPRPYVLLGFKNANPFSSSSSSSSRLWFLSLRLAHTVVVLQLFTPPQVCCSVYLAPPRRTVGSPSLRTLQQSTMLLFMMQIWGERWWFCLRWSLRDDSGLVDEWRCEWRRFLGGVVFFGESKMDNNFHGGPKVAEEPRWRKNLGLIFYRTI